MTDGELRQVLAERGRALLRLEDRWGEWYRVKWVLGMFHAIHRRDGAATSAATSAELDSLLEADFAARTHGGSGPGGDLR